MSRQRPAAVLRLAALLAALAACRAPSPSPPAPPAAEFVVVAGDSSVWVRTGPAVGPEGVEVRRASLLLTRVDGRFRELFVTEDDYSFPDALFAAQTVWQRDLQRGDSSVVWGDPAVPRLALRFGRRHPDQLPLEPDEPGADEPLTSAVTEVAVMDVHGPLVMLETFADLHPEHGPVRHVVRRRVVDLRDGRELSLAALLGDSVGRHVVARGRAAFARTLDSARVGPRPRGDDAHRAAAALDQLAFDEASFALAPVSRAPGVVFYVAGEGEDADGFALPLPVIPVPEAAWWREAQASLPVDGAAPDAPLRRWSHGGVSIEARREPDGETRLALADRAGRRWPLGRVGGAVERLHWLDAATTDAAERAALARAFHDAGFHDGELRAVARWSSPRAARRGAVAPLTGL